MPSVNSYCPRRRPNVDADERLPQRPGAALPVEELGEVLDKSK